MQNIMQTPSAGWDTLLGMVDMSIIQRMQTAADRLTPSERRLVQTIVSTPRDVALGTVTDFARSAGVHEATASRLARKLGYRTYAVFRDALREEFIVKTDAALRVRNTLAGTGDGAILAGLVEQEIAALAALPDFVPQEQLDAAAATLLDARKVFVFARGNAQTLAVMMQRRLRRYGMDVVGLVGDGRDLAEQIVELRTEDVIVAFAFRRVPRHYAPLIERSRTLGARSVVISGSLGPTLTPSPDHLLSAPRSGSSEAFQTLVVPMTICNALVLALASRDQARSLRTLETLGELIVEFETR